MWSELPCTHMLLLCACVHVYVCACVHPGVGSAARLGALACALFNVMLDATAAAERVGAYDRTRKTMIAKT